MPPRRPRARTGPQPSVLIIGSEALPFSKTGGLADVLGALPQAIARLGWDVTLVVPRYRGTTAGTRVDRVAITVGGYQTDVNVYQEDIGDGARALLIEEPSLYDRDSLYASGGVDYPDNAKRFAVLSRAALELSMRNGTGPTVVHAHDWHAAMACAYMADHPATPAASVQGWL